MRKSEGAEMFELVELDPQTGEEDQCLSPQPGTFAQVKRHRDEVLTEMIEDWDTERASWAWLRIQPAQA
jgi:hypothetical protein